MMSLHSPTTASARELASALQDMSFTPKGPEDVEPHRVSNNSVNQRAAMPSGFRLQPTFTMYPLMFQGPFTANVPYVLDRFGPATNSPVSPLNQFPAVGQLYQTPPSPALTSQNGINHSPSKQSYGRSDLRRQHAARINRSPHHHAASHHNHVDIQRIREGIDVRTTVRLSWIVIFSLLLINCRSCCETYPTRWIKQC